jgi:conjugal transfer pilus assembly protein TraA
MTRALFALAALTVLAVPALAQQAPAIDPGTLLPDLDATATGRIVQGILIITVLSLGGGLVALASGRFSLGQVAIPVGVGVGAGTGIPIVTSTVTATI